MSGSGDMDMMDVDQVNDIIHTLRAHPLVPGTGHGVVLLDSVDVHPECVIVIDTNYLISDIGFVSEVLKCANHFFTTILIPKAVVRELDALKSNPGCPVSKEARRANDFLLNALQTKTPYLRGQTLEQESFGQAMTNDDRIVDCCRWVAESVLRVVLLSNDKNLCVKAQIEVPRILTISNYSGTVRQFYDESFRHFIPYGGLVPSYFGELLLQAPDTRASKDSSLRALVQTKQTELRNDSDDYAALPYDDSMDYCDGTSVHIDAIPESYPEPGVRSIEADPWDAPCLKCMKALARGLQVLVPVLLAKSYPDRPVSVSQTVKGELEQAVAMMDLVTEHQSKLSEAVSRYHQADFRACIPKIKAFHSSWERAKQRNLGAVTLAQARQYVEDCSTLVGSLCSRLLDRDLTALEVAKATKAFKVAREQLQRSL